MVKKSHLGIYGIIENKDSILLVKKSRGPYKGMLDLPGGRPEHGEKPHETLVREVAEESGIQVLKAAHYQNVAFTVNYEEDSVHISLHHIALIYKIEQYDHANFNEQIHFEDVVGPIWIPKEQISIYPLSKLVEEVIVSCLSLLKS